MSDLKERAREVASRIAAEASGRIRGIGLTEDQAAFLHGEFQKVAEEVDRQARRECAEIAEERVRFYKEIGDAPHARAAAEMIAAAIRQRTDR